MRKLLFITAMIIAAGLHGAELHFDGFGTEQPVSVATEPSSGLEDLYVYIPAPGARFVYNGAGAEWYKFGAQGGAYAVPLAAHSDGTKSWIDCPAEDCGIIVNDNGRQHCYWLVNYDNHQMTLDGIAVSSESDCLTNYIDVDGTGFGEIKYYTINGAPKVLSRDMSLNYQTLVYDEAKGQYIQTTAQKTYPSFTTPLRCDAPLCDTRFTLTGDRFLQHWGRLIEVSSDYYSTKAVDAHVTAIQTEREVANESKPTTSGLGGSAPAEITFTADVTDAAVYTEWQFSKYPDFSIPDLRFFQTEVAYEFTESGTTYVRFVAADDSGECRYESPAFEVNIGESKLQCPNVFSPGNNDGVNDEWRVSYKSIVSFECHIFNRWGVKMADLSDPAQGWDGKYGGKTVPSGVYYYVIKAKGSDGRNYNLSGDINVINYREHRTQTTE